jgi:hypothetical protein
MFTKEGYRGKGEKGRATDNYVKYCVYNKSHNK